MKRTIITISFDRRTDGWRVSSRGPAIAGFPLGVMLATQESVVSMCAGYLQIHRRGGGLGQLVLKGKNGRIRWERTYGRDPARTPG